MLKPGHVLPEFIMHIQLVKNLENGAEATALRLQKSLLTSSDTVKGPADVSPGTLVSSSEWVAYVDRFLTGSLPQNSKKGHDDDGKTDHSTVKKSY